MKNYSLTYIICCSLLIYAFYSGVIGFVKELGSPPVYQKVAGEIIRLHVIANSDEEEDQEVKLRVRDAVNAYLSQYLQEVYTKEEAFEIIESRLDEIKAVADGVLKCCGMSYGSRCLMEERNFPVKTYGDMTFPEGSYDALCVELGDAKGANWWCLVFPGLCFYENEEGHVPEEAKKKLAGMLDEETYNSLFEEKKTVEWRFFLWDFLVSLFD